MIGLSFNQNMWLKHYKCRLWWPGGSLLQLQSHQSFSSRRWWNYTSQNATGCFFFIVQPQLCSGLTMCCVTATGRLSVESAGKTCRTVTHTHTHGQACGRQQQQLHQLHQQGDKDGVENYVPRLSPSTCSREFSMHCWRVSSGPWRRRRPSCPSEPTTWRECVKPDSGRGESSGNSDRRTKLPPVTGWGIAAVKVAWIINAARRTRVNNAAPACVHCLRAGLFVILAEEVGGVIPARLSSPAPSASAPSAASRGESPYAAAAALSCRVRVLCSMTLQLVCVCVCVCVIALFCSNLSPRAVGVDEKRGQVSSVTFTLSARVTQWCHTHLQAAVCSLKPSETSSCDLSK